MRFFRFGARRLSEAEVQEIHNQVREIHDDLAKRQAEGAHLQDYFVEQDYWPIDRPALGDEQKPPDPPSSS